MCNGIDYLGSMLRVLVFVQVMGVLQCPADVTFSLLFNVLLEKIKSF